LKKGNSIKKIVAVIFVAVFSLLFVLAGMALLWMNRTWGSLSAVEFIYTISTAGTGTSKYMVLSYVKFASFGVAILMVILTAGLFVFWNRKKLFRSLLILLPVMTFAFCCIEAGAAWQKLGMSTYLYNQGYFGGANNNNGAIFGDANSEAGEEVEETKPQSFIDANYVDSSSVDLTFPEKKRNLIYIFLESMEVTSMDVANGGALEVNTIPELTEIARENETFSGTDSEGLTGGKSLYGSGWTVAAMFAQSSGLPMLLPFSDANASMKLQESFLPLATLIGDILKNEGYNQEIIFGSDAAFGGRDLLYRDHGGFEIHDYNWAVETGKIPEDYRVWWGFEDAKLFSFAKEDLTRLAESGEPFNYTMLTVDTHFIDGYLCSECPSTFDSQYANVMACSSKQVSDFVKWIKEQDFYDNTTIILAGDHPTMQADYFQVDDSYDRRTYFTIINGAAKPQSTGKRDYSTMDIFPTTLASLGVTIPGDRLGLGTNLYGTQKTLLETYGAKELEAQLAIKSELFEKLTANLDIEITPPAYTVSFGEIDEESRLYPYIITALEKRAEGEFVLKVWNLDDDEETADFYEPEKISDDEYGVYKVDIDPELYGGRGCNVGVSLYWRNSDGIDVVLTSTPVRLN
jgi:phosphoglycerol transferase